MMRSSTLKMNNFILVEVPVTLASTTEDISAVVASTLIPRTSSTLPPGK